MLFVVITFDHQESPGLKTEVTLFSPNWQASQGKKMAKVERE